MERWLSAAMRAVRWPMMINSELHAPIFRLDHHSNWLKYTFLQSLLWAHGFIFTFVLFLKCLLYKGPEYKTQVSDEKPKNKYTLRDPMDLRSKFLLDVEAHKQKKASDRQHQEMQEHMDELKILEELPEDEVQGNRRHAWVVILSNVEWAAKKCAGPEHNFDINTSVQPFFIEPSTGAHFSVDDPNYFSIESVWNESNYYVSLNVNIDYIEFHVRFLEKISMLHISF